MTKEQLAELEERRAAALEVFRAAVAEVRASNVQEQGEEAIADARRRLAVAMKAAARAGVPKSKLLEASKAENEDGAENDTAWPQGLRRGDKVEIVGLESESGRQLNGKVGVVSQFLEEKGRCTVEVDGGNVVSLRPANLQRKDAPAPPSQPEEEKPLQPGDSVEVRGLESESGMKLNGRKGSILEFVEASGRFKVELGPEEVVSIKAGNLVRLKAEEQASEPEEEKRSRSKSSSSSASASRPRKSKKRRKESLEDMDLTPEEKLEALLTGVVPKRKKAKRPAPPEEPDYDALAREEGFFAAHAAAKAAARAAAEPPVLKMGDQVEVFGLQSEAGKKLNGMRGVLMKFIEEKGRYEVELGLGNLQSLKPDNLRPASSPIGSDYTGATAGYTLL